MTSKANGLPITNITHKEYFVLATHRYPRRGIGLPNWRVLDSTSESEYAQGLIVSAYINDMTKNIVINFDYLGKLAIEKSQFDKVVQTAAVFSSNIKNYAMLNIYKVSHTGYGYGGIIAAECALRDRFPAVIFESPEMPFKNYLPPHITDNNIVTFVSKANADPDNYYGNVYHVELYPDADKELVQRWEKARRNVESL